MIGNKNFKKMLEKYDKYGFVYFSASLKSHKNEKGEIKKDFIPCCKWKEEKKSIIDDSKNCIFIATGEISNCTVIDIDDMTLETSQKLNSLCLLSCNFVVKSKKGFHYYFKHCPDIPTTTNIIPKIDIRNNGGCIIAPPTYYFYENENKEQIKQDYKLIIQPDENEELNDITEDIKKMLLTKKTDKEQQQQQKNKEILNNGDATIISKSDIVKLNYDIIKELLESLDSSRYTNYEDWRNVLFCLKCENKNEYFDLFDNFSKKWDKYNKNDVIKNWNSYKPNDKKKMFTYNSLLYWAKKDNPEKYNDIITKHKIFEEEIENFIVSNNNKKEICEINQEYLLMDKKISNCKVSQFLKNYLETEIKTINIHSPYNTGKTTLLSELCNNFKKILFCSYRITLTNNLCGNFKKLGFKTYWENDCFNSDRLICQVDSLHKITETYDLIIIDESESLLNHFSSPTMADSKYIFDILVDLCANAKKIINLDGDLSNRTMLFTDLFGDYLTIKNIIKKDIKHFILHCQENKYNEIMKKHIDDNKNICIICMESKDAQYYYNLYKDSYKTILYTSKSSDEDKKKLENVEKIWIEYQIIIYSPCIEAGVDFNIKHIDNIFINLSSSSTSQRGLKQMIHRIRIINDKNVNVFLNNVQPNEKSVKRHYNISELIAYYGHFINDKVLEKNKETNKMEAKNNFSTYDLIMLYNKLETLNKNTNCFLPVFLKMIKENGHTYEFYDKETKTIKKNKKNNVDLEKISYSKRITENEYNILKQKQAKHNLTEEEKYQIIKFCYEKKFNVIINDIEEMKKVYGKMEVIKNYKRLLLKEYNNPNETKLKNNELNTRYTIIKQILKIYDIEPKNLIDKNYSIDSETLIKSMEQIEKLVCENKILFGLSKTTQIKSSKKLIGTLKSLLDNYGIIIEVQKKQKIYTFCLMEEVINKLNFKIEFPGIDE